MYVIGGYLLILCFIPLSFCYTWYAFFKYPGAWRKILPIFCCTIFMLGFCIYPDSNNDLTRYYEQIEFIKEYPLSQAITIQKDSLYVKDIVFWVAGKLNMPGLITALTLLIVFGISTIITCEILEKRGELKYLPYVLLLQFLSLPLFNIANNIRNVSAFAIAVYAVYREIYKKKRDIITLILYILPIYIHSTGIVLIALRLFVPLVKKNRTVALLLVFALPAIITIAYNNISIISWNNSLGNIVRRLISASYNYLQGESSYAQRISTNENALIKRYIAFAQIIVSMALLYFQINKKESKELESFRIYIYLLSVLTLSCIAFNTPAYWRFQCALSICKGDLFLSIIKKEVSSAISGKSIQHLAAVSAVYNFLLGGYTLITRTEIGFLLDGILENNVFLVLFRLIGRLIL